MSDGFKDSLRFFTGVPTAGAIIPIDIWNLWSDDEITKPMKRPEWVKDLECSCGAKHTSAPNLHLRYCNMYKDPMGGK